MWKLVLLVQLVNQNPIFLPELELTAVNIHKGNQLHDVVCDEELVARINI